MLDVCFGINQSILCENHDGEQRESAKEEDEGVLLHGAALESADGGAQTVGAPRQEVEEAIHDAAVKLRNGLADVGKDDSVGDPSVSGTMIRS